MPSAAAVIGVPGAATRSTPSCITSAPLRKPLKLRLVAGVSPMASPSGVGVLTVAPAVPSGLGLRFDVAVGGAVWVVLGFHSAAGQAPVAATVPTGPMATVLAHG